MKHKTAKINHVRRIFRIPSNGFSNKDEAVNWYKQHYKTAKGTDFLGSFGFRYDPFTYQIEFDYELNPDGLLISLPYPLDTDVPFDLEVSNLLKELKLPEWFAPALRLIVLLGKLYDDKIPYIPFWLMAPLGQYRVLTIPVSKLSLRKWRRIGEYLGVLPSEPNLWQTEGVMQVYKEEKRNKKVELYWQTLQANIEVKYSRLKQGRKGKKGLMKDIAKVLIDKYSWKEWEVDSYKVSRYLKRAKERWHIEP